MRSMASNTDDDVVPITYGDGDTVTVPSDVGSNETEGVNSNSSTVTDDTSDTITIKNNDVLSSVASIPTNEGDNSVKGKPKRKNKKGNELLFVAGIALLVYLFSK